VAITDVRKLRSLALTESKSDKGSIQLTGSEEYLVLSDTANPSFSLIAQDNATWPKIGGPIPQINDAASFAGYDLYVTSRSFDYYDDENEFAVRVQVRYDAKAEEDAGGGDPGGGGGGGGTDPDTWHRISISTQSATVPLTDEGENGDKGGIPACNSAGDPVDGLTEDRALIKMSYTNTKVSSPSFEKLLEYTNKTNESAFLGCPPRTLRCLGFSGEWDDRNQLWSISVEFMFDPEKWIVTYFDAGFNEIVGGERRAILDVQGNPVSKPVPLDGNGQAVEPHLVGTGSLAGDTAQLIAYPYLQKDFGNLFLECGI
jgi:hypothetical protein